MRIVIRSLLSLLVALKVAVACLAQQEPQRVAALPSAPISETPQGANATEQFTYVLFWKQNDPKTKQFAETIRRGVARNPAQATWKSVDVNDPANQQVVAHYGVSRAPMPLAICVAENGAITSVFTRRPNDEMLDRAIVTPAMVTVTKALQDKKIAVVHVKPTSEAPLPYGALEFTQDAAFQSRTIVVDVLANDADEARFLKDMDFASGTIRDSSIVVMAPPGVLVGKFPSTATMSDIATKLHAAGKCCDDPNCKHNKKAQ